MSYDVAILGSGLGGSVLAAVLCRAGLRVVVIDRGTHPRFAIGESTIPETSMMFEVLADRFDVPELAALSRFDRARNEVSPTIGVKRNFSFVWHREGEAPAPRESNQLLTFGPPWGPDMHLFRQEVDAWLVGVAEGYGAEVRHRTETEDIDVDADGVTLSLENGGTVRCRFLVDASGYRSPVSERFGLRQQTPKLRTRSRTVFTHMVGVRNWDHVGPTRAEHRLPSPIFEGTLHHLFEGGWIWVIPFDNDSESTNPLCSVGACLDPDLFPPGRPPAEEIAELLGRFPGIAAQLEGARPVREWNSTPRLQYQVDRAVGDRYALLPHAAAFIDPLFSSGLSLTLRGINRFAPALIEACQYGDFDPARFEGYGGWLAQSLAHYDRLIANAYVAFRDFELWNAWSRLWMLGTTYAVASIREVVGKAQMSGNREDYAAFEDPPYSGVQCSTFQPFAELFGACAREVEAVEAGRKEARVAAAAILKALGDSEITPPHMPMGDAEAHCPAWQWTLWPTLQHVYWGARKSPDSVRAHFFRSGSARESLGVIFGDAARQLSGGLSSARRYLRGISGP